MPTVGTAATPYVPFTLTGSEIGNLYGKSNTGFNDPRDAGLSGTTGAFGRLGALSRYNPQNYTYSDYTTQAGLTSNSGKRADQFANIMAQNAQAGQLENAERGRAILAGYDQQIANNRGLADAQMGYVDAYGTSQQAALDQQLAQQKAQARQSAIKRGLGNTTIQNALDRGVNADYARSKMQLQDQLLQNRLNQQQTNIGTENKLTGDRLGFLSAIQNPYPTLADISNLYLQSAVLDETKASRTAV